MIKKYPHPIYNPQPHWVTAKKSLTSRLRGIYAVGPKADEMGPQDTPEFGWVVRIPIDQVPGIQLEAAARIEELESEIDNLYHQMAYMNDCPL